MENLKKKTFFTIFIIISLFDFIFAIFFNVQTYHQEYVGILNNLTRMRNLTIDRHYFFDKEMKPVDDELHNRKVMDYEIYTFILDNNNDIVDKISHSDNGITDEIISVVQDILAKNNKSKIYIGCLYFNRYAYNYEENNYLTIINTIDTKYVTYKFIFFVTFNCIWRNYYLYYF